MGQWLLGCSLVYVWCCVLFKLCTELFWLGNIDTALMLFFVAVLLVIFYHIRGQE